MLLKILLLLSMICYSLSQSLPSYQCQPYSASNTNSETENYATCTYTLVGYNQAYVTGNCIVL